MADQPLGGQRADLNDMAPALLAHLAVLDSGHDGRKHPR